MTQLSVALAALILFLPQSTGTGPVRPPVIVAPSSPRLSADARKTPTTCLGAVKNEVMKVQRSVQAAPPSGSLANDIARTRRDLAAQCTSRFDLKTVPETELASLIELYSLADQGERMAAAVDR